jgi:hypothetical protein
MADCQILAIRIRMKICRLERSEDLKRYLNESARILACSHAKETPVAKISRIENPFSIPH